MSDEKTYSIKDVASTLKISRQRVQQLVSTLEPKPSKVKNAYQLTDKDVEAIKGKLTGRQNKAQNKQLSSQLVSVLQAELTEKNKQIEQLQTLLSQSQQLQLTQQNKIKELETSKPTQHGFLYKLFH